MNSLSKESLRIIPNELIEKVSGIEIEDPTRFQEIRRELSPIYLQEQRLIAQAAEILLISKDADHIEMDLKRRGLKLPSAYALFTAGYEVPKDATLLGKYGEYPFKGFPAPAIAGHDGEVYAVKDEEETIMIFKGRAHPNEWSGEKFGNMIVAHPLRVVQELIRRQRADEGVNPPVVLTYVTGVADICPMEKEDLGIIIDDAEGTNILHPGHGPAGLLDKYVGSHFEAKMERSCDHELAKKFYSVAKEQGLEAYPVVAYGTPGTTEYQGYLEMGQALSLFERSKEAGLVRYSQRLFGEEVGGKVSLLLGMGNSFELATLRQKFRLEEDIRKIAIGLATDVGGEESVGIDHDAVVETALKTGERNTRLIMDFLHEEITEPMPVLNRTNYSIKSKLDKLS